MPVILSYLLKLSISLAVVYLFYQFVLRRLTFYNWNRLYLLAYTAICFAVPFIDISPMLERNELADTTLVRWVPVLSQTRHYAAAPGEGPAAISLIQILNLLALAGMAVMLLRFLIQFISFRRMKQQATYLFGDKMKVYQVNDPIIPFSFGNYIFINRNLHSEAELAEIIRHEFVHVRQRHSIDMIWSEWLCLVCWFNPFAWLLKKAIRQNLEFIADNKVLENGIDKKDYQYLLLKVTGNNLYSIATPFNFSSLKKRIAMMNKIRSARVHLVKFMFVLPLVAVLLLAFRSKWHSIPDKPVPAAKGSSTPHANRVVVAGLVVDAKTLEPIEGVSLFCSKAGTTITTDANGYYKLYVPYENEELKFEMVLSRKGYTGMKQSEHWGNFYNEGIYKAFGHTIELFALTRSSNGEEGFSRLAGNPQTEEGLSYENVRKNISKIRDEINGIYAESDTVPFPPAPPAPATVAKLPDNVISIKINNGVATVLLKNGSKETYNISNSGDKKSFEEKYGDVTPAAPEAPYTNEKGYSLSVTDSKGNSTVVVKDKNNKEVKRVLLNTWKEKAGYYENLYGELPPPPPAPPVPAAAPAPPSAFGGSDPVIVQGISTTGSGSARPALSSSGSNEVVVQGYPLAKTVKGQLSTTSGHDGIAVQGNPFSSPDRAVTSTAPDDPKAVVVQGHPFSTTAPLSAAVVSGRVLIQDDKMDFTEADEVITITISKNDSREKLNEYVRYMKENGAELNFEDIAYNKKGELTRISGKIRSRINTSTFSGEDFSQVVLLMYRKGDKTWFNIRVTDDHERI